VTAGVGGGQVGEARLRLGRFLLDGRTLPPPVAVRTAAVLARQVVEETVADRLERDLPGAQQGTMRAQLLCLRSIDARLGEDAAHLHGELSRACHHQAYELGPSVEEAVALIERTEALTRR
jgi:hypothetical protein